MNEINDLYDIIDAMRKKSGMSSRSLALLAKVPPTTLASLMSRRPATIDKEVLKRIASVFNVSWVALLNKTDSFAEECENELRIPVAMTKEDVQAVNERVVAAMPKRVYSRIVSRVPEDIDPDEFDTSSEAAFRRSIYLVLNRLNENGLLEAMRRVLEVAGNPAYCKPKKEDDSWQKEKPPMGAEQSESAQTVDTRDEFPLE